MAGTLSFARKIEAAGLTRELGFPLTINVVLHRHNLDRIEDIIALAEELGARRLELANTQYQGWAAVNRAALMPTREQIERGEEAVARARERLGPKMEILWVLPDYFEDLPEALHGRLGSRRDGDRPNGDVLPCQAAATIPGLEFENVREQLAERNLVRVGGVRALPRYRLDARAVPQLPARPPGAGLRRLPLPGARARGDAAATDPVCHLSPHHDVVVEAREVVLEPVPALRAQAPAEGRAARVSHDTRETPASTRGGAPTASTVP